MRVRFIAENRFSDPVEVLIDDFMVFAGPSGGPSLVAARPDVTPPARASSLSEIHSRSLASGVGSWTFRLSHPAAVRASLFDVQGRLVRKLTDGVLTAGDHTVRWDGRGSGGAAAASGVYWLRIQAEEDVRTAKFVLTR